MKAIRIMKAISLGVMVVVLLGATSCSARKKLAMANQEIQRLTSLDSVQKIKLADNDQQISQLKDQNGRAMKAIDDCKAQNAMISSRADRLNQALARQGAFMREVRRKAAEALNKYQDKGVDVTYKDGLVYISMQDKLVFQSASATVNNTGKEALSIVASVLNDNPDLKVTVVGNTDSLKIRGGKYIDNWSLSTERSNSIIRVLRDQYGINPARLTSSGRGKYDPIADNSTEVGRARNRRTDIVLNPDLSQLWALIDSAN